MTTIQTSRLILRPLQETDVESIWSIHGDQRTNTFNPAGPMDDRQAAINLLTRWVSDWRITGHGYWAVQEQSRPSVVIGFGGVRLGEVQNRRVYNLYYRFAPEAWGNGYATELVAASITWWNQNSQGLPLVAVTTEDNVPSQKTAINGGLTRRPDLDDTTENVTDIVYALGWD